MVSVHVAQLLQSPVGTQRQLDFREARPVFAEELGLVGPLEGHARLTRTSHGILVECEYRVTLTRECGRCLGISRSPVEGSFSEEFLPTTNIRTGLPETMATDPDEPRISPTHVLDFTEEIRQDIVVQQPLQPLCRPDCAGLCPVCGEDLNEVRCGHEPEVDATAEQELGRLGKLLKDRLSEVERA